MILGVQFEGRCPNKLISGGIASAYDACDARGVLTAVCLCLDVRELLQGQPKALQCLRTFDVSVLVLFPGRRCLVALRSTQHTAHRQQAVG